jgi:hypothetical protein
MYGIADVLRLTADVPLFEPEVYDVIAARKFNCPCTLTTRTASYASEQAFRLTRHEMLLDADCMLISK